MASLAAVNSTDAEVASPGAASTAAEPLNSGRFSQSALWVIIARGWSVAATAALSILLPRWFGANVAACGEAILLISLVGIAAMIGSFGLPETMIRLVASRLAKGESGAVRLLVFRCSLLLLATSLASALSTGVYFWLHGFDWFQLPQSVFLAMVVAATIIGLSWQMVDAAVLRGLHDVKWANLLSGGQSGGPIAVTCLLGLLAIVFVRTPAAAVTSMLVAQLLLVAILGTACLTIWRLWRILPAAAAVDAHLEQVPSFFELAFDALPIALSQVAAFCTLSADLWLTGSFLGPEDVAYYGSAKRLVLLLGVPEQLAILTIIAIIPDLYARGQRKELQRVVQQAVTLAAVPAILAAVVLICIPQSVLGLTFGPKYTVAASVLVILTLGQLAANCLGPCGYVLLMTGQRWAVFAITLSCGIAAIVLGSAGAHFGGMRGLAIAAACCTAAQVILEWIAARRLVGIWCHASALALHAPTRLPVDSVNSNSLPDQETPL